MTKLKENIFCEDIVGVTSLLLLNKLEFVLTTMGEDRCCKVVAEERIIGLRISTELDKKVVETCVYAYCE